MNSSFRSTLACLGTVALLGWQPTASAQEFTFGVDEAVDIGATSTAPQDMERGLKLYDAKDYAGATLEFQKVLQAKDPEADRFKPKATYSMGKALYRMGLMQASLSYFNKIVEVGPEHKYHRATLKWLYLIYVKLGDPTILEKLSRYDVADYPDSYRSSIAVLVGKHHYLRGNLDQALESLRQVDRGSPEYAKAKFLEGIVWVRKNQAKPAVEAFKEILRVIADNRSRVRDAEEMEQLAWLSMARIFYATGQYELAIKYYDKLPQASDHWLEALLEASWAYFQLNNYSKALGNLHTLNSPFFEDGFFPESLVLQAIIYFYNCKYKETRATVEKFMAVYPILEKNIGKYLKRYAEPSEFWDFLMKLNKKGASISSAMRRIFVVAFGDKELSKRLKYLQRLDDEIDRITMMKGKWAASPLAEQVLEDLQVTRSLAVHEAGTFARSRLDRVRRELQDLKSQALKIKFETANAEVGRLEQSIKAEQYVVAGAASAEVQTDEEHVYWPFQGEYWKDELGFYYYEIVSECR